MTCDACLRAEEKRRHEEVRQFERRKTVESVPTRYRWASSLEAPELASRVKPSSAIEQARKDTSGSVVLIGPSGAGKTSLGTAILLSRIDLRRGLFVDSRALVRARQESRLGQGEAPLVDAATTAHLLLLDELGAEAGVGTAESVVAEIVHERHAWDRPTIFTTPYPREHLIKRYGDGIVRRIFDGATVITLGGGKPNP